MNFHEKDLPEAVREQWLLWCQSQPLELQVMISKHPPASEVRMHNERYWVISYTQSRCCILHGYALICSIFDPRIHCHEAYNPRNVMPVWLDDLQELTV